MEARKLGRAGLSVPVVGMGTWSTLPDRMTANAAAGDPPWFDREARDPVTGLAQSRF